MLAVVNADAVLVSFAVSFAVSVVETLCELREHPMLDAIMLISTTGIIILFIAVYF